MDSISNFYWQSFKVWNNSSLCYTNRKIECPVLLCSLFICTHTFWKIRSMAANAVSICSALAMEKYESGSFEAGGYKWKLVLYPKGNKSKNVMEHLSLYIAMADSSNLQLGWEVHVVFRLFLLDQIRDNYLILPDSSGKECRFHGFRLEWGFDQLIPLATLKDTKNGYLVEDTCVFGAEVFVRKESCTGKGECLSMIKSSSTSKNLWRFENFSKLDAECNDSKTFVAGDQRWKIQLYPKGKGLGSGTHLSLFLALADLTAITPGFKILADFTLRILDQSRGSHLFGKANFWFSASSSVCGWSRFYPLDQLYASSNAYLFKDTCLGEAEITVLGITDEL
eukprot:XP_025013116.1 protein RESTRICTED TEV MOVEMENT 3 isoform X2 [Ricinus communis]